MSNLTNPEIPLLMSPLSFLRGGVYSITGGAINYRSVAGCYWSRYSSSTAGQAYGLGFDSTYLRPQIDNARGTGRSLRCLARIDKKISSSLL